MGTTNSNSNSFHISDSSLPGRHSVETQDATVYSSPEHRLGPDGIPSHSVIVVPNDGNEEVFRDCWTNSPDTVTVWPDTDPEATNDSGTRITSMDLCIPGLHAQRKAWESIRKQSATVATDGDDCLDKTNRTCSVTAFGDDGKYWSEKGVTVETDLACIQSQSQSQNQSQSENQSQGQSQNQSQSRSQTAATKARLKISRVSTVTATRKEEVIFCGLVTPDPLRQIYYKHGTSTKVVVTDISQSQLRLHQGIPWRVFKGKVTTTTLHPVKQEEL